MNKLNSLGCCWELKLLENPIFRKKQHRNKKIQMLRSVLVLPRTRSVGSYRNSFGRLEGDTAYADLLNKFLPH